MGEDGLVNWRGDLDGDGLGGVAGRAGDLDTLLGSGAGQPLLALVDAVRLLNDLEHVDRERPWVVRERLPVARDDEPAVERLAGDLERGAGAVGAVVADQNRRLHAGALYFWTMA